MRRTTLIFISIGLVAVLNAGQKSPQLDVTVSEGTSMSVAVSPDGRTLAIDLQGSIWTLPSSGGPATRITDLYNDARQPAWSPDGKWIAFFGYRDGGYDIWAAAPDGSNQHKLTWGPFDDREPVWSHSGGLLAFSSDRGDPLGSDYNIWVLDVSTGALRQITTNQADDYMPTWSPDDKEIAFASSREDGQSVWAVNVMSGEERKVSTANGRVDAPSWGPGGQIVYHVTAPNTTAPTESRFEVGGRTLTGGENVFAFRASWPSSSSSAAGGFFYVSDGKIRKRQIDGAAAETINFTASLPVTRVQGTYTRRTRDFTSTAPRQVLGIVSPAISPDGKQVAFAAVGDLYVMPVGGKPINVTQDRALDTDPAWSPDGQELAYSSDKDSDHLQLWIRDMRTGKTRRVTQMTTQPQGAAWSPDGKRIAFFDVDGNFRAASVSVLDLATGSVTKVHDSLAQPGAPTWSADGKRLALTQLAPFSKRFREGTNQVLTMAAAPGSGVSGDKWFAPLPTVSIDSREGCGPVWSPDGSKMAAIFEGVLQVWPVSAAGEPLAPPRRLTNESAHSPSWTRDSRSILYQSMDHLRLINIETGESQTVPLDLKYTPAIPTGRMVVHAGKLIDMKSPTERSNVDIVIERNRIVSVGAHAASNHSGAVLVDATNLTVMPGLTDHHVHLEPDTGEAAGRAYLAFGVTTVRSTGNTPYEAVEEKEANEAGVRPGPRIFGTGGLMEWQRAFHKMSIVLSSPAHMEMEMERAKILQHDLLKSYVRLPDLQQKRMVEFAHSIGIPVTTHELYPAAFVGVDGTEHTGGTSRRGYATKIATLQRAYDDVIQLFGKSGRFWTPTITGGGVTKLFQEEPELKNDPRFKLYPEWIQRQVAGLGAPIPPTPGLEKMVMDAMHAGAIIVTGTDAANAFNLHGELRSYVMAGMTPYEALKAATVNPAQSLNLDAGVVEAGKLADLVIVEGDPLVNIGDAHKVRRVIANGRLFEFSDLVRSASQSQPARAAR